LECCAFAEPQNRKPSISNSKKVFFIVPLILCL
jgi:hypothetical protein